MTYTFLLEPGFGSVLTKQTSRQFLILFPCDYLGSDL